MSIEGVDETMKTYKFEEILQKYTNLYVKIYEDFNKEAQLADIAVLSIKRQYEIINKKLENTNDYMNEVDTHHTQLQGYFNELCKVEERLISIENRLENIKNKRNLKGN